MQCAAETVTYRPSDALTHPGDAGMHETILTDRTARAVITPRVMTPSTRHVGGHPPDIIA